MSSWKWTARSLIVFPLGKTWFIAYGANLVTLLYIAQRPYCEIVDIEKILVTTFLDVIQHAVEIIELDFFLGRNKITSTYHPWLRINTRAWGADAEMIFLWNRDIYTIEPRRTKHSMHIL